MRFTASQLQAVDVEGRGTDTCVVAGPGSGKTTVLVEYFQRLVRAGVDPLRILAITFTEKAAGNMRAKLARAFEEDPALRGKLERAYVSTVHGFCARLLRENAIFAGIDPEFYVTGEQEALRFQETAIAEVLDGLYAERPEEVGRLLRGLASPDIARAVLGAYDAMRAAGVTVAGLRGYRAPAGPGMEDVRALVRRIRAERTTGWSAAQREYLAEVLECCERIASGNASEAVRCNLTKLKRGNPVYDMVKELRDLVPEAQRGALTGHYAGERELLIEILDRFDRLYRERKMQAGALDYSDLEEFAVRLLRDNDDVRSRVRGQFDEVLMDEFQDTNGQQARLLELVRPPGRFYAVGDINQSIYGFRHAEPGVFRAYRDEVAQDGRRLVELRENFRSRADILRAVETILDGAEGIEPRPLVPRREFAGSADPAVEAIFSTGDGAGDLEARWVARRILELAETREFQEIAVLVRNSEVMGAFTDAFEECGIPYLVNRGKGFYETREVADLMHMLRVLLNPRDDIGLAAVLRSPFVEISDEALLRLKLAGGLHRLEANLEEDDRERLSRFRRQLAGWRAALGYVPFDRLLWRVLEETGYPYAGAARNVEKFLAQARAAASRQTAAEFVEELETIRAADPREPEAPPEDSANAVRLMTVHSAKGLEFPIVFLAALHKGFDQSVGTISFSPRYGLGARWRNPSTGEEKDDRFLNAIRQERSEREKHESDRLFYVAMTRAEELLVLSAADGRNWAKALAGTLSLDLETPRDEILQFTNPAGEPWRMRVRCVDGPPAAMGRPEVAAAETVTLLPQPAVADQHDSNASVTAVNAFAACPRRYYLTYYLGFEGRAQASPPAAGSEELSASAFGRQVHALLAGTPVADAHPAAIELAARFPESALGKAAARAGRSEREFDFLLAIDDQVLRGQIDLWYEQDGELVLIDYKTDRVSAAQADARARSYELQVQLYALALRRLTGRIPDRAYIYLLRPNVAVPVAVNAALLAEAEETVREFREAQANMRFPLREGPQCGSCPHWHGLCPAGDQM